MLSMKFPHLFLRPEIIITFLWGWEWSGGQVRHRSPRNSGSKLLVVLFVNTCVVQIERKVRSKISRVKIII